MKKIPLLIPDLPKAEDLVPYLKRIDQSHHYTNYGPLNTEFEHRLLAQFKQEVSLYVTTVANNTLGLMLALEALNLPKGSKVLLPSFTFIASAAAIVRAGLTPVFADIDRTCWLLTPELAQQACEQYEISAVMPVASLAYPHDAKPWDDFVTATEIPVVIDAAGAFGNQMMGEKIHLVFSLHATKALGIGEGGFIISHDANYIQTIRQLSNFGFTKNHYEGAMTIGINAKLSEYHAAVGLCNLQQWPHHQQKRAQLLNHYLQRLSFLSKHINLRYSDNVISSIFAVRLQAPHNVNAIAEFLLQQGIETRRWYYPPAHLHPAFKHYPTTNQLPQTLLLAEQLLGLPFHEHLQLSEVDFVVEQLGLALQKF